MTERAQTEELGNPMRLARRASLAVGTVTLGFLVVLAASTDSFAAEQTFEERCGSPNSVRDKLVDSVLELSQDFRRPTELYAFRDRLRLGDWQAALYPEYTRRAVEALIPESAVKLSQSLVRVRALVNCELQHDSSSRGDAMAMLGRGRAIMLLLQRDIERGMDNQLKDYHTSPGARFALEYALDINAKLNPEAPHIGLFQQMLKRYIDALNYECTAGVCTYISHWVPPSEEVVRTLLWDVVELEMGVDMLDVAAKSLDTDDADFDALISLIEPSLLFARIAVHVLWKELIETELTAGLTWPYLGLATKLATDANLELGKLGRAVEEE